MNRFTLPRDIYFGKNSLEALKALKGKKAIVVTGGSSMKKFGFLDKVDAYLRESGMEVKHIEGIEPDPSVETVMNGAAIMREFEPDWIVSIGGGSPIDAAKAMWIFYEYPEFTFEQAVIPFGIPELRQKARFVAIPSTSGTATEVTAFSVITDYKAKIKYPLADFNLTPDVAIVDPAIAQTMPPTLVAQCLAGMAFSNALLGITHSMAHKTGAVFHIPHGCANAIFLPYVIDFNKKACGKRYAEIAISLGLKGNSEEELINSLTEMIEKLNRAMNVPCSLTEYGVDKKDFEDNLQYISENAVKDACTGSNPRTITVEEMKKIFTCAFKGEKVNF